MQHSCAVDYLGGLHCWGYAGMGRIRMPRKLQQRRWKLVSCGGAVTCGIDSEHHLECWGAAVRGHTAVPQREQAAAAAQTSTRLDVAGEREDNSGNLSASGVGVGSGGGGASSTSSPQAASVWDLSCDMSSGQCLRRQPFHWLSVTVGAHHACGTYLRTGKEHTSANP